MKEGIEVAILEGESAYYERLTTIKSANQVSYMSMTVSGAGNGQKLEEGEHLIRPYGQHERQICGMEIYPVSNHRKRILSVVSINSQASTY